MTALPRADRPRPASRARARPPIVAAVPFGSASQHRVEPVGYCVDPADQARQDWPGDESRTEDLGSGGREPVSSSQSIQPRSRTSLTARPSLVPTASSPATAMPKSAEVGGAVVVEQHVRRLHVVVDHAGGVGATINAPPTSSTSRRHPRQRPWPAADDRRRARCRRRAAGTRGTRPRLAPVVVERHDVRVLEAGDEPGLGLEATDERRSSRRGRGGSP